MVLAGRTLKPNKNSLNGRPLWTTKREILSRRNLRGRNRVPSLRVEWTLRRVGLRPLVAQSRGSAGGRDTEWSGTTTTCHAGSWGPVTSTRVTGTCRGRAGTDPTPSPTGRRDRSPVGDTHRLGGPPAREGSRSDKGRGEYFPCLRRKLSFCYEQSKKCNTLFRLVSGTDVYSGQGCRFHRGK